MWVCWYSVNTMIIIYSLYYTTTTTTTTGTISIWSSSHTQSIYAIKYAFDGPCLDLSWVKPTNTGGSSNGSSGGGSGSGSGVVVGVGLDGTMVIVADIPVPPPLPPLQYEKHLTTMYGR